MTDARKAQDGSLADHAVPSQPLRLLVWCPDKPGIIAAVVRFL